MSPRFEEGSALDPKGYSDDEWLELMIEGLETGRPGVPSGPPPEVQARFVGWSGEAAMRECYAFYQLTKRLAGPSLGTDAVLDFGVGWGRLIRLFAHDIPTEHLVGVDVDPEILAVCADTGVPGQLSLTVPGAPLPFPDGHFGLAYAYSVFSHLSADAAVGALAELARVLKPGGQLTFTTQGARFLELCCGIRDKVGRGEDLSDAERMIDSFFAQPNKARKRFAKGRHVYTGTGGSGVLTGDFYGWAAVPERWLRKHAKGFDVLDITDDPAVNEQVVITLRRT
jgi:SAM-dependent methyltransferase